MKATSAKMSIAADDPVAIRFKNYVSKSAISKARGIMWYHSSVPLVAPATRSVDGLSTVYCTILYVASPTYIGRLTLTPT